MNGYRFKQLRNKHNYSREELAEKANVDPWFIAQCEDFNTDLPDYSLWNIASLFNMTKEELSHELSDGTNDSSIMEYHSNTDSGNISSETLESLTYLATLYSLHLSSERRKKRAQFLSRVLNYIKDDWQTYLALAIILILLLVIGIEFLVYSFLSIIGIISQESIASLQSVSDEGYFIQSLVFFSKQWLFILGIILIIAIIAIRITLKENRKKEIRIGISSKALIGINYKNAVSILKQRGFTNIKTSEQKDLMPQEASKAGNVAKVIVGSFSQKTVFEPNSLFPFDSEITIIYHTERTILSRLLHKPKKQTPSIRVNRIRKENSSFHSCFYMLFKGIFIMILCVIGLVATCVILGYIVRAGYL